MMRRIASVVRCMNEKQDTVEENREKQNDGVGVSYGRKILMNDVCEKKKRTSSSVLTIFKVV